MGVVIFFQVGLEKFLVVGTGAVSGGFRTVEFAVFAGVCGFVKAAPELDVPTGFYGLWGDTSLAFLRVVVVVAGAENVYQVSVAGVGDGTVR